MYYYNNNNYYYYYYYYYDYDVLTLLRVVRCWFNVVLVARTVSSLHSMMVTVVCLYVLLYEDQLSDDPIWFVFALSMHVFLGPCPHLCAVMLSRTRT